MNDDIIITSPRRYLTADEALVIPDMTGLARTFRIRVWRAAEATTVVLISRSDPEGYPTGLLTCKIANYVNECVLGHPPFGMLYYEYDGHALVQVYFHFYGNCKRLKMFKPERIAKTWERLEYLVGETIEA